jgi:hypothetical protein
MYANGHTGLAAVARLQRIGAALAAGEAPDREDARWLAGCFDRYFLEAAAGVDLDAALGLTQPPGVAAWWHARRHAERDSLLRQAAGQYSGSTNAKAIQLQQRLKRYAATSWPRDRASRHPSDDNRLIFAVFMVDPEPPTGIRRLTDILTSKEFCSHSDLLTARDARDTPLS